MDGAGAALTGKASAVGDGSALADSLRRRPVSAEKLRLRRSILKIGHRTSRRERARERRARSNAMPPLTWRKKRWREGLEQSKSRGQSLHWTAGRARSDRRGRLHNMALRGSLFALSASGIPQAELEREIKRHGGNISRTVHKRVNFLIVTPAAVAKDTQAIRKCRKKFRDVQLVVPEFVRASVTRGSLCNPADFQPGAANAAAPSSDNAKKPKPRGGASLAEIGLQPGGKLEVLVEMSDGSGKDPLQWWPCTVEAPLATGLMPNTHPLVYHVLRSRGYKEETHSRCRFERPLGGSGSNGNGHNKLLLPDGANGRLLDVDEGLWRPWRFCAVGKSNKPAAAAAAAPAARPVAAAASSSSSASFGARLQASAASSIPSSPRPKPLAFVPAASCSSSPPKRIVGLTRAESGIEVCMGYPYRGVAEYLGGPFSPTGEQLNHPMGGMVEEVVDEAEEEERGERARELMMRRIHKGSKEVEGPGGMVGGEGGGEDIRSIVRRAKEEAEKAAAEKAAMMAAAKAASLQPLPPAAAAATPSTRLVLNRKEEGAVVPATRIAAAAAKRRHRRRPLIHPMRFKRWSAARAFGRRAMLSAARRRLGRALGAASRIARHV